VSLLGAVLIRSILIAAVLLAMLFLYVGSYALAATFVGALAVYAYLLYWGGVPIEERL
jgi:uncharacterized membrane protein YccC